MLDSKTQKRTQGFSLIELLLVISIVMVLAAFTVPRMMHTVSDISLRYAATDFSGLLQTARIQAVRKNTFYTLQPIFTGTNITGYFVDVLKTGAFANGDPNMAVAGGLTIFNGTGSGAPNEAGLVAKLSFAVNPGADQPSFNARGLPCIVNGNACAQTVGSGYITFVSKPVLTGNAPWAAVAINPSGHIQVWTSDNNGNWIQRD